MLGVPGVKDLGAPLESHHDLSPQEREALAALELRLGHWHVRQRLGLEQDYEAEARRRAAQPFDFGNWSSNPSVIRSVLKLLGLYRRSQRNALAIEVRRNEVYLPKLPGSFEGFSLLQLSDLHFGMSDGFMEALVRCIEPLSYDLCVLTGDYRALTYGPFQEALEGLRHLKEFINGPAYAILGNHDTIRMVPAMEEMGYRLLLNEAVRIPREGEAIYLAGIDDAHFYRMENFQLAARDIPPSAISVLLSHTPETYRDAARAAFDLILCGHTHGGQLCLPGGFPVRTDSTSPRRYARGAWRYGDMIGYTSTGAGTSIVGARLNCPPEIVLHRLRQGNVPPQ